MFRNEAGAELVANAHRFVSARAAARFLGYLRGQEARISGHSSRPELVAAHGFDTKHAMRAMRLGLQGVELLATGRITLGGAARQRRCPGPAGPGLGGQLAAPQLPGLLGQDGSGQYLFAMNRSRAGNLVRISVP